MNNDILNDPNIKGKNIYFQNFINFLQNIISGKINNSNKKDAYRDKISNIEHEVVNALEGYKIKAYIKCINNLKHILFGNDTSEIKSNDDKKTEEEEEYVDMPHLETEEEAAERIADFYEQRKESEKSKTKNIVSDNEDDDDNKDEDDKDEDDKDEDNLIKNARSLLKDVENDKFNEVKVNDRFISKNKIIKFLKKNIKGDINDNNKLREYSTNSKSIKSIVDNAPKKSNNIKKYIKYFNNIKKILPIDDRNILSSSSSLSVGSDSDDNKKTSSKIKADESRSFEDQEGSGYVNLAILLSKIYTNNSTKELKNNIKELINNLHDNKQITKQVYTNLIKAITYKNDL